MLPRRDPATWGAWCCAASCSYEKKTDGRRHLRCGKNIDNAHSGYYTCRKVQQRWRKRVACVYTRDAIIRKVHGVARHTMFTAQKHWYSSSLKKMYLSQREITDLSLEDVVYDSGQDSGSTAVECIVYSDIFCTPQLWNGILLLT